MIEGLPVPTAIQALLLVAVVLIEALILYVGYGHIEQAVAPALLEKLENI